MKSQNPRLKIQLKSNHFNVSRHIVTRFGERKWHSKNFRRGEGVAILFQFNPGVFCVTDTWRSKYYFLVDHVKIG